MSVDVAATLSAYQRWAPLYAPYAHSPLMRAEERAMLGLLPSVADKDVLDLACGSGRYTRHLALAGVHRVVATDFCLPMLQRVSTRQRVCADMMRLPFVSRSFDLVISGLAVGHAWDLSAWMGEMARVLRPGGALIYSDFHPEAVAAGHQRTFRDSDNQIHHVPHACHDVESQCRAAKDAGLQVAQLQEVRIGVDLNEPDPQLQSFYERWHGLAVVLVVRADKPVVA